MSPKAPVDRTLEAVILADVLNELDRIGYHRVDARHFDVPLVLPLPPRCRGLYFRVPLGPMMHGGSRPAPNPMAGFPDIGMISLKRSGSLLTFEIKSSTGSLSIKQKVWSRLLQAVGVRWALIRSVDDLRAALLAWNEIDGWE